MLGTPCDPMVLVVLRNLAQAQQDGPEGPPEPPRPPRLRLVGLLLGLFLPLR